MKTRWYGSSTNGLRKRRTPLDWHGDAPRPVNSVSDNKPSNSPTSNTGCVVFGSNAVARWAFSPIRYVDRACIRACAPFTVDGLSTTQIDEGGVISGVTAFRARCDGHRSLQRHERSVAQYNMQALARLTPSSPLQTAPAAVSLFPLIEC